MKILSIDVGMKNLAFCLFNIQDDLTYKIELWDVLDLCKQEEFICKEIKKDGKPCNKKAKFCKLDCYYCKSHAKNQNYIIPSAELNKKKLKKMKLIKLKELAKRHQFFDGKKIKKDDLLKIINDKLTEYYFDCISHIKATDMNLVQYGRNLMEQFNETLKDVKVDGVVVENQIGPLALRMKTLQGMIMQHFIEKNIPLVEEVSATNKLKEFLGTKKTTYAERKKASIEFTQATLVKEKISHKWIEHFNKHKKRDDLADSFLQGRWYLNSTILKPEIK